MEIKHRRLNSQLRDESQATESFRKDLAEERKENERLKASQSGILASELLDHLTYWSICTSRPRLQNLAPVCHEGVKLREYLASDPRSAECATNMLYLPGRSVMVGEGLQHVFAVTPMYVYDCATDNWRKYERSFPLGTTFSFFCRRKEFIYYAGEYTIKELCPAQSDGAMLNCSGINLDALADTTLLNFEAGEKKNISKRTIKQLYTSFILKVLPLGLQCVGFDEALYNQLKIRFEVSLPMAKRKEIFASEEESKSKKRRLTNTTV
ncbi:hypothetical protein CPB83DRAFT_843662 [Crepidotus variabilis]|uniref:Uncharacterized protein n=1 Tax=Crepidotus variabilis TaxID=179855 RepID=A0A9P6JWZ0_9AGAR|nr:hypothetical protein CPB83DRAFT_843662 [Crepidotus variabilis]